MNSGQKKWFALSISAKAAAAEAIEFALNELDSLGTEIDSLGKTKGDDLNIVGYFNEIISEKIVNDQLYESLRIYGFDSNSIVKTGWQEIEDKDWLAEWKKHWKPTITDKFIIAPPWEEIDDRKRIVIKIEPNMAFGTGTHETTRLCLKAIEQFYLPGMSFFDLGTGTGILSIAAAKLRSSNEAILACDTDEDSVKIATENAGLNQAGKIDFYIGSISDKTPQFDFVCANVTADVIVPLLPLLKEKTKQVLILSGILVEQESLVTDKLRELGVDSFDIETDGEWIGITIKVR